MSHELSTEQRAAFEAFICIADKRQPRLTIGGYAGTGKTTLIKEIIGGYPMLDCEVCTPTGKAAHVLRSKGVDAVTLHSLLYRPRIQNGKLEFSMRHDQTLPEIVIVDEASMLTTQLVQDLESRVPHVLYVGDHGQLEPVGDDPGTMRDPDVRLELIHRQAEGSPIIKFAHRVRRGQAPQTCGDAARVVARAGSGSALAHYDVILCAYNKTRCRINAWVRRKRGYSGRMPKVGETVICLRNHREFQVWNGMTGTVTGIDESKRLLDVQTDDGPRRHLPYDPKQFGLESTKTQTRTEAKHCSLWDFGYCLTVHKAQGSEWSRVAVLDEVRSGLWSVERWRYTAATRAASELLWVQT